MEQKESLPIKHPKVIRKTTMYRDMVKTKK